MTDQEKAQIILRHINEFYALPSFLDDYLITSIRMGLREIAEKEKSPAGGTAKAQANKK